MPLLFPQWTEVAVTKFLFPIFIFKHEGRWLMCGKRSWVAEKCWRQEVFPVAWRERFLLILLKSYTAGWDCPCTEEEWTQTKACLASYVMEMVRWEAGFFSPLLARCSVMAVAEALDLGAGSKCFAPRSDLFGCSTEITLRNLLVPPPLFPHTDALSRLLKLECVWCNYPTHVLKSSESHQIGSLSMPPF